MREHGAFGADRNGMTVRKKIVERHGGKIWLETEPGKGSTFFYDCGGSLKAVDRHQ